MSFQLSERSKSRCAGVDPRLIEICDLAIQITVVDFGIPEHGGVRTVEEQHGLFLAEASKADGINDLSNHQIKPEKIYGEALDFYAYVDDKASWDHLHLALVACAFLQAASILGHRLEWGGLWKNFGKHGDMPHVQLAGG